MAPAFGAAPIDAAAGVEVGTVDEFEGQEALVVFYSMASCQRLIPTSVTAV